MLYRKIRLQGQGRDDAEMDEREYQRLKRRQDRNRSERDRKKEHQRQKNRGFSQWDGVDDDDEFIIEDDLFS